MTPIAGFVLALVAGRFIARSAVVRWVVVPWLAVLAVQTGWLAAGEGDNPASTVTHFPNMIGYAVVQAISLGFAVGIARSLAARRRPSPSAGTGHLPLAAMTLATAMISLAQVVASAPAVPGHGRGGPPVFGILGLGACILTTVALTVTRFAPRLWAAADRVTG